MSIAETPRWSLRQDRAESSRLAWAVVLSLSLHLLIFGTYTVGRRFQWWEHLRWPAWLQPAKKLAELLKKKETPPPQQREAPLLFVEVSPEQAVATPPKEAKFYSNKNAVAANPEATRDTDTPKITGTQKQVVKTEDVPREKFVPLQPSAPPPPPKPEPPHEEMKPKPAPPPGDLAMAKPEPVPRKEEGTEAESRPRTLEEARARLQKRNRLLGEKMQQDGGVERRRQFASLDTKETPFGDYDAELVEAICQRWYSLLDERDYASDDRGKVVLQFTLSYDGHVTGMRIAESTVSEVLAYLCQKAVQDPSPYKPWPSEMRRMQGDTRQVQFTFYYN